ncbi:MAG: hypothetical protein GTN49_03800 [candidate division Zixibacteria bacterium]|nr:hypothetical protein [candidate division Zixibacteria bacterium]
MKKLNAIKWYWLAVSGGYAVAAAVLVARVLSSGSWRAELSPLYALLRPQFSPWGLIALPLFALLLALLPRLLAARAHVFLPCATLYGAALALAVNMLWTGVADLPARGITVFLRDLRNLGGSPAFLGSYHELVTHISDHGHVRPPGLFLFLWSSVKIFGQNLYVLQAVVTLLAAAAAFPIYALARRFLGREASGLAVLLYLLSGSFVTHGVSYDGLFATLGAAGIYLLVVVAQKGRWRDTVAAGALFAIAAFSSFTLAFLPVLGGALLIYYGVKERAMGQLLLRAAAVVGIPAAFLFILYIASGYDFLANFRESYRWAQTQASGGMNVFKLLSGWELPSGYPHPSYYRSYWLWVPANLFATFFTLGIPTAALYLWWARDLLRRGAWAKPLNAVFGTALVAFLLFNLTGVTLGETERIWLYLLPILTIPAAARLAEAEAAARSRRFRSLVLVVLFSQVVAMRLCFWIPW